VAGLVRRKAVLILLLGASTAMGLCLTAVALMMAAAVPVTQMPAPWLLAGIPAANWLVAGWCWWRLHRAEPIQAFGALREQIALDAQMLNQAHPS
jgi:hypothetical protein